MQFVQQSHLRATETHQHSTIVSENTSNDHISLASSTTRRPSIIASYPDPNLPPRPPTHTTTTSYRQISPATASLAASTSIERSNNHRAMLSHRDSLHLRARYDHATNPPLRSSPNHDLFSKLAKLRAVLRRALDKRARKLNLAQGSSSASRGGRAKAAPVDSKSTVRRVPVGGGGGNQAKHYSEYTPGKQPQIVATPIYDAHRQRRMEKDAPVEFYRAWAMVQEEEARRKRERLHGQQMRELPLQPTPTTPKRKALPPPPSGAPWIGTVPHHRVQTSTPDRRNSMYGHLSSTSTSPTTESQTCPPEALQIAIRQARAEAAAGSASKSATGREGRVTRISDFAHAYSPDCSVDRRPVSGVRQGKGRLPQEKKQGEGREVSRCSVCGLAVPYTAELSEVGLWLCPGCRDSRDGVFGEVPPPVPEKPWEERLGKKCESRRVTAVVAKDEAWRCEHCGVGFGSGVPESGRLCICPICGGEIRDVWRNGVEKGASKGKGRRSVVEVSRFSGASKWTEEVYDEDEEERGVSRWSSHASRRLEMTGALSPVSSIGKGRFDGLDDGVPRGPTQREHHRPVSAESRQTWESDESKLLHLPGIDTARSHQMGPNLYLAYDSPSTPPAMSSAATTQTDLRLPHTPPLPPPRTSSKVGFLKSKTKQRLEAQDEQLGKSRCVASSIYPADEVEKEYCTSDKPLPPMPRGLIVTQRRLSVDLEPAEMEAIASMPPLNENSRDSGIWPVNQSNATLPLARTSSFYSFYKPILES